MHILFGEDDYSIHQAVDKIKKGLGSVELLETNTTVLEGHEVTLDQLRTIGQSMPFLAAKRLVIVNGLLARFEPKGRGKPAKSPSAKEPELWQALASCLTNLPESTAMVLVDSKIGRNNPLLKELTGKAQVKSFPMLRGDALKQWVLKYMAGARGSISQQAIDLLVKLVGSDLWVMTGELQKLLAFTGGRRIEEADVTALVSSATEASVFVMVDAILESRAGSAQQLLQDLLERGASPAYLLVMLARQVQLVLRAKGLKAQRMSETEMQSRLGLVAEFAFRRTLEQASRYSLERLKAVYHRLLETDLAIKTGRYDGELALNILVAELCQRQ